MEICGHKIDLSNLQSTYINCDCMQGMKEFPDKYFDLAIVDPPYGGGNNEKWDKKERARFGERFDKYHITEKDLKCERTGGTWSKKYQCRDNADLSTDITHWDIAPSKEYFEELFRVSKNQIIWGGN